MKYLAVALLVFGSGMAFGQQDELKRAYTSDQITEFKVIQSPPLQSKPLSFQVTPSQADMKFDPSLKHPVSHNLSEQDEEIQHIKLSKEYLKKSPGNLMRQGKGDAGIPSGEIVIGTSFYGDIDGACPNDNTIAISKAGRIISMMNEYVGIYNAQGRKLNNYTLNDFFSNFITESICDPKVEYDPVADRFFMYIQGCNDNPQKIAFGFSQSNDPNGNWAIYLFESDALADNSWSDYPKVAINQDEIFVSMNLFSRGGSSKYKQSIMYQLNKFDGYQSKSLNYKIWTGFQVGTILPVRSGARGLYGPGIYALQASAAGSDFFEYYDITGKLSDPTSTLLYKRIATAPYEPSGNAYQLGTTVRLDIGDCRLQDGYYQDGIIHFVFSADDEGYSGIRYHRLDPNKLNGNTFEIFSSSDFRDYCYPSIAPFSNTANDKTSIIHFTSSGENHYPDIRAKLFNNDFSSATSIRVKVGPGPQQNCYNSSNGYARWGDYSGICRNYGTNLPTVWIAGSVGNDINGKWWTYISELYLSSVGTKNSPTIQDVNVYPNPAVDRIHIEIQSTATHKVQFILKNSEGKPISTLYEGILLFGTNQFSFTPDVLPLGVYYISIETVKNEIIKTHKFVVAH